jgi:uncharacterized protein
MDTGNAVEYLGRALQVFSTDMVMFFGGEPSLNQAAIIDSCLFLQSVCQSRGSNKLPVLGMVSNFYSINDVFLALCKKFDIHVTVSIDGPRHIHDEHRLTRDGQGSYDRVRRNMLRARQEGIPIGIECTYTAAHQAAGMSVVDLMQFFQREFAVRHTHIVPMITGGGTAARPDRESVIDTFCDAVRYMIATRGSPEFLSFSLGSEIIRAIAGRRAINHYCPAGLTELTVADRGDVYPCFMFVGRQEMCLGSLQHDTWLTNRGRKILDDIRLADKTRRATCRTCWARHTCRGCLGADYLAGGNFQEKTACLFVRSLTAEAVVRLAEAALGLPDGHYGKEHRYAHVT